MFSFLKRWRQQAEANRRSLAINDDNSHIAEHVPELSGMESVEGMAYTLEAIKQWNSHCSSEQAAEFASRLKRSTESWKEQGLTMPYWGNLWVLRTYQAELGIDAPPVSPLVSPPAN